MLHKLYVSLFTVLPLGGLAFALFKYVFKQLSIRKNGIDKSALRISLLLKIIFSLLGGIYGTAASISFIGVIWFPGFKLSQSMILIALISLLIFNIALLILIGWSKAIEAGAGSIGGVSTQLKAGTKNEIQIDNPREGQWQRKSEAEILQIKKQLKNSSYSPVMPTGVLILVSAVLYAFLRDISNGSFIIAISSSISFFLTYLIQIVKGRSLVEMQSYKICNKCYRKDDIGLTTCFCGGTYEPKEFYLLKDKSGEE